MQSLDEFAAAKLAGLEANSLRRALVDTVRVTGIWTLRDRRRLLSFCCNDYLNLTHHPAVVEAASQALRLYGVGAGASRLITGNHPLFAELERRLARLKETQDACVFGSGFLANLGIIPALVGQNDLVLIDELSHACLFGGARLARATVVAYRHSDLAHAEALLAEQRRRFNRARTLIYSTGLPPAIAAAAIAALDLIEREPAYAALPVAKAKAFARGAGLAEPESPIVPVIVGDAKAALAASHLLEEEGFLVTAIRPPTVPFGTARLRLTFSAQHPDDEIERLAQIVRTRILAHEPTRAIAAQ